MHHPAVPGTCAARNGAGHTAGPMSWLILESKLLVDRVRHLVGGGLRGGLKIADRLLYLALGLLDRAFGLKALVPDRLADLLLDRSGRLICQAGGLVLHASHVGRSLVANDPNRLERLAMPRSGETSLHQSTGRKIDKDQGVARNFIPGPLLP